MRKDGEVMREKVMIMEMGTLPLKENTDFQN